MNLGGGGFKARISPKLGVQRGKCGFRFGMQIDDLIDRFVACSFPYRKDGIGNTAFAAEVLPGRENCTCRVDARENVFGFSPTVERTVCPNGKYRYEHDDQDTSDRRKRRSNGSELFHDE